MDGGWRKKEAVPGNVPEEYAETSCRTFHWDPVAADVEDVVRIKRR